MKYIKVTAGDMLWGKETLTKDDLANADTIIDLENLTQFNKNENRWGEIGHD